MSQGQVILVIIVAAALAVFGYVFVTKEPQPDQPQIAAAAPSAMPVPADAPAADESQDVPPMGAISEAISEPGNTQASQMPDAGEAPLMGKKWMLNWLVSGDLPQDDRAPYLTLEEAEHQASGMGGCNRFSGPFLLNGDALSFPKGFVATEMACEQLETETAFFKALGSVTKWAIEGDRLVLSDANGAVVARLTDVASIAP